MILYTFRHMIRHWRLMLALLIGITVATGYLAGLPTHAEVIAAQTLAAELQDETPAGRNAEILGSPGILTGSLLASVDQTLGELLAMRVEQHSYRLQAANEPVVPVDGGSRLVVHYINVWSFEHQRELLSLVAGDYPGYEPPHTQEEIQRAMQQIPVLEACISSTVAKDTGIQIGDMVYAEDYRFLVVGLVEPVDAASDAWWGDLSPFQLVIQPGINEDTRSLPLIIDIQGMRQLLPDHPFTWRLILNTRIIGSANAVEVEQSLINLKTIVSTAGGQFVTNLPNSLLAYRENLATVRMVLLLLSVQAQLFVYYALFLLTSHGLGQLQSEMAVLAGRGASHGQILLPYVFEGLLLALLAGGCLGPWEVQGVHIIWARITGESVSVVLSQEARILAWIGAGFGWLAICLGAYPSVHSSILEWQKHRARPIQKSGWQSNYLDLILLGMGGLAYWQLSQSGSFVMSRLQKINQADPVLLLGPSLLILALALAGMRFFPYVLQGLAWLVSRWRGLVLTLGLARISRDPSRPAQVTLLISLAVGLIFFTRSYEYSLGLVQADLAHYRAGADLRVVQGDQPLEAYLALPGVQAASAVSRIQAVNENNQELVVLGVDPQTLSQVAHYQPGLTTITIDDVLSVVRWEAPQVPSQYYNPYIDIVNQGNPITGVFSFASLRAKEGIGSQVNIWMRPVHLAFTVQGMILNFPTLQGDYLVVDREALEFYIDLDASQYYHGREVWLAVQPEALPGLLDHPLIENAMLANVQQELRQINNNAYIQGLNRAFVLNTLTLSVLSVCGLFLIHYFSARRRSYEFSVLRSNGLTTGQLLGLLTIEAIIVVLIGLLLGTGIGLGLSQAMRTYLNLPLSLVEPGLVLHQIQVDWRGVLEQYAILVFFYLLAVVFSLLILLRSGVHRVLRLGEE